MQFSEVPCPEQLGLARTDGPHAPLPVDGERRANDGFAAVLQMLTPLWDAENDNSLLQQQVVKYVPRCTTKSTALIMGLRQDINSAGRLQSSVAASLDAAAHWQPSWLCGALHV
eukprot:4093098-Pleurochrysis_carterae.AAC.1